MSRRNRDYSGIEVGPYHRAFRSEDPFWLKIVASGVSVAILWGLGTVAERIGDAWRQRNDETVYDKDARQVAAAYAAEVMSKRLARVVSVNDARDTQHEVPSLPKSEKDLRNRFSRLANASKPGGQPKSEAGTDPYRYDLEWDGYAGKNNRNAPKEYCVDLNLPDDTSAVVVWQNDGDRATVEVLGSLETGFTAQICQYGRSHTPEHHDVAVMTIPSGSR